MDDLLDLSWSEQPKPAKVGGSGSAFDLLSRPGQGNYYSGSTTPLPPSKPASATGSSANLAAMRGTPNPRNAASPRPPAGPDAFSDLLGAASTGGKSLSMAERQAQLAAQKAKEAEEERSRWGDGAFWDQLGSSSPAPAPTAPAPAPAQPLAAPTPAKPVAVAALQPSSRPASARPGSSNSGSFWDMESSLGQPKPQPQSQKPKAKPPAKGSFWDMESALGQPEPKKSPPKDDFDLLNGSKPSKDEISWDDGLLGSGSKPATGPADPWDFDALSSSVPAGAPAAAEYGDDDDLLGELGKPVRKPSVSSVPTDPTPPPTATPPRTHAPFTILTPAPCRAPGLAALLAANFASCLAPEPWRTRPLPSTARHRAAGRRDGLPARGGARGARSHLDGRGRAGRHRDSRREPRRHARSTAQRRGGRV
jgi:hypothetical protein